MQHEPLAGATGRVVSLEPLLSHPHVSLCMHACIVFYAYLYMICSLLFGSSPTERWAPQLTTPTLRRLRLQKDLLFCSIFRVALLCMTSTPPTVSVKKEEDVPLSGAVPTEQEGPKGEGPEAPALATSSVAGATASHY